MSLTISNAESAYLLARAQFGAFMQAWMQEWFKPYADTQALMMWDSVPAEVKARWKELMPEKYGKVESVIAGMKGG